MTLPVLIISTYMHLAPRQHTLQDAVERLFTFCRDGLHFVHEFTIFAGIQRGGCVQGLTLAQPEVVPFRLTQNMIDGYGVSGIEGVFRRTAEITLQARRPISHFFRRGVSSALLTF